MLKDHGIENVTESPTNYTHKYKYPFSKFTHSLRLREIYSFYDTKYVKVKPGKGYAIRRVLGDDSHSTKSRVAHQVFIKGMEMIVNGIVDRKFIFKMPFKNLDVTFKIIKVGVAEAKRLFKFYRGVVDPFDLGFEMYKAVLHIRYPKRPDVYTSVHLSSGMYNKMIKNKKKGLSYENSKIATIDDITKELESLYPTLEKISISSIMRHGLNTIFKALLKRCDSYINLDNTDNRFFVYFCGARVNDQFTKVRSKIRFLLANKKNKPPHDGTYYFYLTDNKKLLYDQGEDIIVNCTRYLEELHIGSYYARHIFKVHVPDCMKQGFITSINNTTEGVIHYESFIDNNFKLI